jgi:hypothetical protein
MTTSERGGSAPVTPKSIYAMLDELRAHPDYVAGVVFTRDDFANPDDLTPEAAKAAMEYMTDHGFTALFDAGLDSPDLDD